MKYMIFTALSVFCFAAYADWESFVLPSGYTTESSLEKAIETARSREKSVIVYYTRANCPPCRIVQSYLHREEIKRVYGPHYVFTVVWGNGMDSGTRQAYRAQYNVLGSPTWIIFNRHGDYLCTAHGGFRNPEAGLTLHQRLQDAISLEVPLENQGPRSCSKLFTSGVRLLGTSKALS